MEPLTRLAFVNRHTAARNAHHLVSSRCSLHYTSRMVCRQSAPVRQIRTLYAPEQGRNSSIRCFSVSHHQSAKKGGKQAREEAREQGKDTKIDDPTDFAALEKEIATALEYLKQDLSKLRSGGRFNHELLENLRVPVEKNSSNKVKLGDLAQVIPKGRTIQIIVGEKDHLKQVSSAIQGSDLSLTPQPDPTGSNPLMLEIKIPPPTAESRQAAVKEAAKAGDKAANAVNSARSKQHKAHRAMQLAKTVRSDDLVKAAKLMEKIVEKGQQDVKKTVDSVKKMLETV